MIQVLLVIHLLIALALVGVILLQRSEGGALGIGGGGGGGGLMTGRAAGNLLTRATGILAALFMVTSLVLALLANNRPQARSIMEQGLPTAPAFPGSPSAPPSDSGTSVPAPQAPAAPPTR
jgi:preprotein translocase subunit SecG